MSSLSDKLKNLGVQVGTKDINSKGNTSPDLKLADVLPGTWTDTPHGATFIVSRSYSQDYKLGGHTLLPPSTLHAIAKWDSDPGLTDPSPSEIAYIDTETTGLSGGTGTYTFLVGVGTFQDDKFVLKQFFMRDPAEESAQLAALEAYLAPIQTLVSYNGKSFDLPRLHTRYRAHHWPPPLQNTSHIDLLHLVRRLWSNRLSSCTLGEIEHHILGVNRSDEDIPGWQIADIFYDYLQSKDPSPLSQIFYHNQIDILSMVILLRKITTILDKPTPGNVDHPLDLLSLGKFYGHVEEYDQAIHILEDAISHIQSQDEIYYEAIKELSFLYKKQQQYESAMTYWEVAADAGDIDAHIELAKYCEHHLKAFQDAVHWTLSAMSKLEEKSHSDSGSGSLYSELEYRLQRLKRKCS